MNDTVPAGMAFVMFVAVGAMFFLIGTMVGFKGEISRLEQKCLVEMQDKIHKEATEICKERVK